MSVPTVQLCAYSAQGWLKGIAVVPCRLFYSSVRATRSTGLTSRVCVTVLTMVCKASGFKASAYVKHSREAMSSYFRGANPYVNVERTYNPNKCP